MSFILDALKKSEAERLRKDTPGFSDLPGSAPEEPKSHWFWIVAVLVVINVTVLAVILMRPDRANDRVPEPLAVNQATEATAASPVASTSSAVVDEPVRAEIPAPKAADPVTRAVTDIATQSADPTPAVPRYGAPQIAESHATFNDLRAQGLLQLPDMHLDIHVYSSEPEDRAGIDLGATAIPQAQHDLRSETLAIALRSGIHRVIQEQDFLNRINVFPVADGDTGTNLSLSLGAALETIARNESNPLCTLLAALADALLDSARGNSGAIVAQFFQGLSDYAESLDHFSTHTFAGAVSLGSEYARDALANPREGTVLSVIAVFASSLRQQTEADHAIGFARMLNEALVAMQSALVKTTEQLEELRKADVVDAGASGFVTLIEGMTAFIADGEVSEEPELSALFDEAVVMETAGDIADVKYRFCTECIVTGDDIDRRKLRESLSALGDSLVLAGTKRKAKIHIHVNEPEAVFDVARIFGRLAGEKADDMLHQQQSTHDMRTRFAVITDSAADISDEDMERHDIHMVPVRIQFGDRGYLDKVSISSQEFFRELAENPVHPTSSQPSPGDFRRQYQFLASHFPDVISINLTPEVSGTLQAAQSAASRVNAAGTVHTARGVCRRMRRSRPRYRGGPAGDRHPHSADAHLWTGTGLVLCGQRRPRCCFAQVPRRLAAHYPGTAYRSRRQDYGEPLLARTAEPAVQIRTTHRKALQACGKPAGRYRARAV
jgi:hypothetical protein